jgi:PTS system ascorbate-specific IIA component
VLKTGLSWVSLDTPVEFGNKKNDPVDLVVGLAALDHDAHIGIMSKLAGVLADPERLAQLRASTDVEEIRSALAAD